MNVLKSSRQSGGEVVAAIERLTRDAGLHCPMLGPIELKGRYAFRVILKGKGAAFSALLSSLYGMPGVHIEPDPLNV